MQANTRGLLTFLMVLFTSYLIAQSPALPDSAANTPMPSLADAFKKGAFSGQVRYFFMGTKNTKGLTDYNAQAVGGVLKYETASFKNLQAGISYATAFNMGSSNLAAPDSQTKQYNRYEIGLFDITNPNEKQLNRLEELYLQYHFTKATLTLGKQLVNTPFLNLQDGRMRPTAVEGLWANIRSLKNTKIEGGYLYRISPRSTQKWYTVAQSIGVNPQGVNTNGTKAAYASNLQSNGIAITGITHQLSSKISVQLWEQYVDNIFNTLLLQAGYQTVLADSSKLNFYLQLTGQNAMNDGGNKDPQKTYFEKGSGSFAISTRAGWQNKNWEGSGAYTRITAKGRYLMPREWGKDPFFTFLPRERADGLGDVHATVFKLGYNLKKTPLKTALAAGYYQLPDVNNTALNKYGMPSYYQVNADIRYRFNRFLKGLDAQLLYVYKGAATTVLQDRYVINKVAMSQLNFILNYTF